MKYLFFLIIFSLSFCNGNIYKNIFKKEVVKELNQKSNNFEDFFEIFDNYVINNNKDSVIDLINLPFPSISNINNGSILNNLNRERFLENYDNIMIILPKQERKEILIEPISKTSFNKININNIDIFYNFKSVTISSISGKDALGDIEISVTYLFGEHKGKYKLLYLQYAG